MFVDAVIKNHNGKCIAQKLYQQALIIRKEQIENNRERKRLKTLQEFASVVQAEQRKLNGNGMMESN